MKQRRIASDAAITLSFLTALVFCVFQSPAASAQVLYGSIVGTITDQSNAVVVKATVTVTNTSTGLTREAQTNQTGYYAIPTLQEGTYDVSITLPDSNR